MDDARDALTGKLQPAISASRYRSYVCLSCGREARLFRGAERVAHFRHRFANPGCPLSVDEKGALGPGYQNTAPTGIAFDRNPPEFVFDQVTSVLTFVAARQSERNIPVIEHHDHGRSTQVADVIFADKNAGGVRVDTMCSLFANEDYFFWKAPPILEGLVSEVNFQRLRLARLRFSPRDISRHAELRSWAAGEGFKLKNARHRIQIQQGAASAFSSDLNDETNALLYAPSWHAAITIRSPATRWTVTHSPNRLTLSGMLPATNESALDTAGIEVTIESPGTDMRFASSASFEPRTGPLERVSYPVATRDYPLNLEKTPNSGVFIELRRVTEVAPKLTAPTPRTAQARTASPPALPKPEGTAAPPRAPERAPSGEPPIVVGPGPDGEPTTQSYLFLRNSTYPVCCSCGRRVNVSELRSHGVVCLGRGGAPNG